MKSANKVVVNTGILYARMLITMGISLYSTRLVLNALGSVDYGVFNLVAGVIAMLSFLNTAMATSTQRFLSFFQGKNDLNMQKRVFTNSLLLHIGIGLLIVVVLEVSGFFLFNGFLNIPADRMEVARLIYHFMSVTVFFTIVAVPFTGSLVAHENMLWVAVVNVVETLLKLAIAYVLYVVAQDKLSVYGLLTAGISIASFLLYAVYCFGKYEDCTLEGLFSVDKKMMKELTSFAGWNLFGSLCSLGRAQGLAILLNVFFGTVVNAAYAIANQVAAQLNFFSLTLLRAINPQIMKSEGADNREKMLRLSMIGSKFGFFLLAFAAVPCIFEMKAILHLWLNNVPEYTASFCSLMLCATLINQLTIGLQSAVQATGKVKVYQAVVGSVLLLALPLAYLLLKLGYPVYTVFIGYCFIEVIACILRLFFLRNIAGLSIPLYFSNVIYKVVIPLCLLILTCYLSVTYVHFGWRFVFTGVTGVFVFVISIYLFGLCEDEKEIIHKIMNQLIHKLNRKKQFNHV
ncbi:Na+-driven multidrug efflux pump [Pedobacter steynii]|uniref:Na+-driven multidrug efflux pump n=1 Tax=Pedobacter steynii TaxID=430522 RepID=A0A1G9YCW5_9SPHI|nr:MATE family efflux transporter [Pedobacter steynii]NQX39664.1 hypothetical protein [Pedobacter steynii]SDN06351.1 Na+-driven multidrug efflux pump [Pedobacter steynii]